MKDFISNDKKNDLLSTLESRFIKHPHRHPDINWVDVKNRLLNNNNTLLSIYKMEDSGGEPDVICFTKDQKEIIYCDCSKESPAGRRSLCYDKTALDGRKQNKPIGNVIDTANEMGITLLDEFSYKLLQTLEPFDTKTSSWLNTPNEIRELGGAIFADFRYNNTFIYHNGASSYYAARGFRGMVKL